MRLFLLLISLLLVLFSCTPKGEQSNFLKQNIETDVCVYGATASGIMAAIAVKSEGKSVVLVEPSKWVGGILGAGIKPIQDCPNFEAVGGTTRKLMSILGTGDSNPLSAKELREISGKMSPKQLREDFFRILKEHDIKVVFDHRIRVSRNDNEKIQEAIFDYASVDETGCPVAEAKQEFALKVKAKVFIDASYDGELMARSTVSYRIGRESTFDFDEKSAGVGPPTNLTPLDPFIEEGNSASGILPLINDKLTSKEGSGDYYTQAYNFRFYVTSDPANRAVFKVPGNYDPANYELVGRYVDYLKKEYSDSKELNERLSRIFPGWMNVGEYNYHRNSLITMAPVGVSHLYADGDYGTKSKTWKAHQEYSSGVHHFMSTDPRVPEAFRKKTEEFGLDLRHHPETQGWPNQLYVRITRRLVGNYTITSHDVYNETIVDDPIVLAQYGIDTYPARRVWLEKDGQTYVGLEGNMFVGGPNGPTNVPYPISYRAITPKKNECTNLLVPVCFSATHLGYASAHMEPVLMTCGESAGIVAVQAVNENVAVQEINMKSYQDKLLAKGQKLKWNAVN